MDHVEDAKYFFVKMFDAGEQASMKASWRITQQFTLLYLALSLEQRDEVLAWAEENGYNTAFLNLFDIVGNHAMAMKRIPENGIETEGVIGHKIIGS